MWVLGAPKRVQPLVVKRVEGNDEMRVLSLQFFSLLMLALISYVLLVQYSNVK